DGLDGEPVAEGPGEVVARHEVAQARMERVDVVVLEIDLQEGLPVVVALVDLDMAEHVAAEVDDLLEADRVQVRRDVARPVEEQAAPVLQGAAREACARLLGELRRAEQFAAQAVGPAMQRADDVAGVAAPVQHDGLAVAAHVREQFHASVVAHQHPALVLRDQGVVVPGLRNHEFMTDIARALPEEHIEFASEEGFVEVGGDGQLRARGCKQLAPTQVRHSDPPGKSKDGTKPCRAGAPPRGCGGDPRLEGAQGYPKWRPGAGGPPGWPAGPLSAAPFDGSKIDPSPTPGRHAHCRAATASSVTDPMTSNSPESATP